MRWSVIISGEEEKQNEFALSRLTMGQLDAKRRAIYVVWTRQRTRSCVQETLRECLDLVCNNVQSLVAALNRFQQEKNRAQDKFQISEVNQNSLVYMNAIVSGFNQPDDVSFRRQLQQEKPTSCGTKAADALDNFFSRQTIMRIHWIYWCICNCYDFKTPINSKCCFISRCLTVI